MKYTQDNEQIEFEQRPKRIERIGAAMLALRRQGEKEPPPFRDFISGWNSPREVPDEALEQVAKMLEAEVRCRTIVGDKAYFASRSIGAKSDAYMAALVRVEQSYAREGLDFESGVAWVDFKLRFARYLKEEMKLIVQEVGEK